MRNIRQTFLRLPLLRAAQKRKGVPHRTRTLLTPPARPIRARTHTQLYSSILAKISASLKRKYSYKIKKMKKSTFHKKNKNTHLLSNFDSIAPPTRQQHPVARLDRRGHNVALFIRRARSDGDHRRLRERIRRGRSREEYSRCRFLNHIPYQSHFYQSREGRKERTVSGLKRWTKTRSRRGTRDLMDLNVAWAAAAFQKYTIRDWLTKKKVMHTMTLNNRK